MPDNTTQCPGDLQQSIQTFQAEFLEDTELAVLLLLAGAGVKALRKLKVRPEVLGLQPWLNSTTGTDVTGNVSAAALGVLGLVTTLALAGLLLRLRLTWRLEDRREDRRVTASLRRLSVSSESSSGGFEAAPGLRLWSGLYSPRTTPVSPATTVSSYLDQWSVGK